MARQPRRRNTPLGIDRWQEKIRIREEWRRVLSTAVSLSGPESCWIQQVLQEDELKISKRTICENGSNSLALMVIVMFVFIFITWELSRMPWAVDIMKILEHRHFVDSWAENPEYEIIWNNMKFLADSFKWKLKHHIHIHYAWITFFFSFVFFFNQGEVICCLFNYTLNKKND